MFPNFQNIHFVGIGGIGMSGIAELLLNLGYRVTGSDQKHSSITTRLRKKGAKIYYQHQASNIDSSHVVVISSAIHPENPELIAARQKKIPIIPRAEMLSELMRLKYGIAIAGSHGKTTTTSLVGHLLMSAGFDPTVVIGGKLNSLRTNAKLGKGEFLVAEADESDGSFMLLNPSIALITNIDPEHMEHYKDFETLKETFVSFANKVPFYGSIVACVDHPVVRELAPRFRRKVLTYGLKSPADYSAKRIRAQGLKQSFELKYRDKALGELVLNMPGLHNVSNALGAIAIARELDVSMRVIRTALKNFKGIQRRLQILFDNEVTLIDDYGHHPIEIEASLKALKAAFPKRKIKAVFQPHRYTRTRDLFEDFSQCFKLADQVVMTEIYPAGEEAIVGISGRSLAKAVQHSRVEYHHDKNSLAKFLHETCQKGDLIVTLGAGDITKVAHQLAKLLKVQAKPKK
ncbi:MAG: UDP-N-acetylmuramate--L-alanine ligase [Deltaproteobacteria bacterium]|nr:UDP-N-acetylmuramate--L-alanine ligase [Deltaproteobacteria bacterium]